MESKNFNIPIIIPCYNRPKALIRLLNSLDTAYYPQSVTLYISIEGEADPGVKDVVTTFVWKHGKKKIIEQAKKLGLKKHIISCGDIIINDKLDGAIILEDDLFVSPYFYGYSLKAVSFFQHQHNIAGISLFLPNINETNGLLFSPLPNNYDNFFMQLASSWGQIWQHNHWKEFKNWLENSSKNDWQLLLPSNVGTWPETSWKKEYIKYMIEKDLYFVYPYISLTTNFGDVGTHFESETTMFQSTLLNIPKTWNFVPLEDSGFIYDSFGELLPKCIKKLNVSLACYDFDNNLNGTKQLHQLQKKYVLMQIPEYGIKNCIISLSNQLRPIENNALLNLIGKNIGLIKTNDLSAVTIKHEPNLSYVFKIPEGMLKTVYMRGRQDFIDQFPRPLIRLIRVLKKLAHKLKLF